MTARIIKDKGLEWVTVRDIRGLILAQRTAHFAGSKTWKKIEFAGLENLFESEKMKEPKFSPLGANQTHVFAS